MIYFLSDAHLGSWAMQHRRTQERRLVRFLDSIKHKAKAVYLLGDMFDFWNEYRYVVPKGYTRFLGKISELTDMGVEPFLIASAVAGVMGQRLCRRLCPQCKKEVPLDMKYYSLDTPPEKNTVFEPAGCDVCTRTGYKGRRALFEVLEVDEDIEGAIVRRENATQIRNLSLSKGMKTLREDGWAKVFAGVTSVKEILRVTEDQ